jgi:DNA repair exonuclease SbcCD nuclease subunit
VPGRFNIGLLHTSLAGNVLHDPYAPTDLPTLVAKGYDYFALGHIHARQVLRESAPRIVYPGNLQGRHVGETGAKGCELVTVEDGRIVSAEHVSLEVVRWHQLSLSVDGIDTVTALAQLFQEACRGLVIGAQDKLHTLRVKVQGETALHRQEALEPGTIAAAVRAATQDFAQAQIWIESVQLDLRSPIDRATLVLRDDAVGEVLRLVDELARNDGHLAAWIRPRLEPFPNLPSELAEIDTSRLTTQDLLALLADAEATVLARLSAAGV